MKKRYKSEREKGKIKLSRMFQKLELGDRVAIMRELSEKGGFPKRLQGRTGVIEGKRGRAYIVKVKEFNAEKKHIIQPIHLKRLESVKLKEK
jgi:large subunit ribosomal protein L21e